MCWNPENTEISEKKNLLGNEISFSTNYDLDTEWKIIF